MTCWKVFKEEEFQENREEPNIIRVDFNPGVLVQSDILIRGIFIEKQELKWAALKSSGRGVIIASVSRAIGQQQAVRRPSDLHFSSRN